MEDLKAYIESGVLELYVLGDLTEGEKLEVETMLDKHPQLRNEVTEIEKSLESYSQASAVNPPEDLRSKILGDLETSDPPSETPVIPLNQLKNIRFYKYGFAASVALLILSLIALINMRSQLKESQNQITALQLSNRQYSSRVNFVEKQLDEANQSLSIFHKPDEYKIVSLKGTPKAPSARMMVAFNPEKAEVMIDLASVEMPANDNSHQYQLWALVDGKPVDLGVFDADRDSVGMIKMKSLKNAQAFAVTLEPRGGSINPTMEMMMAMGAI